MTILTKKKQEQEIAPDPRNRLDEYRLYHPERAQLWVNVQALRELVKKGEASLVFQLGTLRGVVNHYSIPNAVGPILSAARSDFFHAETGAIDGKTLGALKTMLDVAEQSEEFKTASQEYEKLLQAVADLDSAESERDRARCRAEAAVRSAEQAAKVRALASVETDSGVLAAKEALKKL